MGTTRISFMINYNTRLSMFMEDTSGMRLALFQNPLLADVCTPVRGSRGEYIIFPGKTTVREVA